MIAHQREHKGPRETVTRIAQYEMAFRMQASVPEIVNFSSEPKSVLDAYGPDVQRPGSCAYNCLLARRLSERGVRFVQLFIDGQIWDNHTGLLGAWGLGGEGSANVPPKRGFTEWAGTLTAAAARAAADRRQ